ncbi:site-specific integrase [Rhizobium leguminosarum]|uniref:site-specific integrase n=1 Tax=Rhizobium leguminosarum TaxID=384 RepID=UPI003F9CE720
MTELTIIDAGMPLPALVASAGERTTYRLEFFAAQIIRNPNTRRAYARSVGQFCLWLEERGVLTITAVSSVHVAAYVETLSRDLSAPTVKQHLAAIRSLFDWLAHSGSTFSEVGASGKPGAVQYCLSSCP